MKDNSISSKLNFILVNDDLEEIESICMELEVHKEYDKLLGYYNDLAFIYEYRNDLDMAIKYYLKIINLLERKEDIKSRNDLSNAYNNLAIIYIDLEDYQRAEEYYLKAIKIKEEFLELKEYSNDLALTYNNLGTFYYGIYNTCEALKYYLKSLEFLGKDDNSLLIIYENIMNAYLDLDNYKYAIIYCEKIIELCKEMKVSNQYFSDMLKQIKTQL